MMKALLPLLPLLPLLLVLPACASQTPPANPPQNQLPPATPVAAPESGPAPASARAADAPPPTCPRGTRAAADGLISDFESAGDAPALGGREETWRIDAAEHAVVTLPAPKFSASEGGPPGSKRALHFVGKTAYEDVWGAAVVVTFLKSGFYDASKYAGVAFKIKSAKPDVDVRLKISDVNTDAEGGQCTTQCWNSFGKELMIGPEWQSFTLMWSDLSQQRDWGFPRPPAITPGKIKDIQWNVYTGEQFDFWIDDIRFLECN